MSARNEKAGAVELGAGKKAPLELNDELVRDYLKQHDDFLQRNPDMLDYLHISHASGSAVSLVEKQVSILRERNIDMRQRLNTLTGNARENDTLYSSTRALVLNLLDAQSTDALYENFQRTMHKDFKVDHACMILFGNDVNEANYRVDTKENADAQIGSLFRGNKAVSGTLRKEEINYLFPEGGEVGSAALVPLLLSTQENSEPTQLGLIAVGSADANRYGSGVGTLFLSHIADVVVRLLQKFPA